LWWTLCDVHFSERFDHARIGAKAKDNDGKLPLHRAWFNAAPVEVISALLAAHPDGKSA
jgi:hypothetical protein